VNAVSALYGPTAPFALNDATWAKHRLGEFAEIQDPERDGPATANPWRRKPLVRGKLMAEASIEALQARGAVFLVCDLALGGFAVRLTQARGGSASELHDEFRANLLPGVVLVPNVVVSIQRAQRRGLPYYRL
jgi:intracellular sulfur oxidation DsrE/DsrF family protein